MHLKALTDPYQCSAYCVRFSCFPANYYLYSISLLHFYVQQFLQIWQWSGDLRPSYIPVSFLK